MIQEAQELLQRTLENATEQLRYTHKHTHPANPSDQWNSNNQLYFYTQFTLVLLSNNDNNSHKHCFCTDC